MSYYVVDTSRSLGADPGCADVPYPGPSGSMTMGQVCQSGTSCGMESGVIRAILENLGYHCDGSNCTQSLKNFRTDRGLPQDAGLRGDIIITDCKPLYDAWVAIASKSQEPPPPTPLPKSGTTTIARTLASKRTLARAPAASAIRPAATTEPEPVVGFWEARSTVEKALIIGGGVAVVGAIAFAFTR